MSEQSHTVPFYLLVPPYDALIPLDDVSTIPKAKRPHQGVGLVWNMVAGDWGKSFRAARDRAGGIALITILPPAHELESASRLLSIMEHCRPQSVLPFHQNPHPREMVPVLRRFPDDLPVEVTDYLLWRGIDVDMDTMRLIRRTIELSEDLRTVSSLARAVYLSRRALGRRFMSRGLPVPSHWLHFARILRATLRLQNSRDSLFSIACDLGYPDGFALSNQMMRLTRVRPSMARQHLGWEWLLESWIHQEVMTHGFSSSLRRSLFPDGMALGDGKSVGGRRGNESSERDGGDVTGSQQVILRVAEH
jgi:AraC-like DNA-binding protein